MPDEPTEPDTWESVRRRALAIAEESLDPFQQETIDNFDQFLNECQARYRVPDGIGKGYWPTIRVWWANVEVEVFAERYELYRFAGSTDMCELAHAPGEAFPPELLNALDQVVTQP